MPSLTSRPTGDDLPCLELLAQKDTPVTLTRIIKGVSFHHPASMVSVEADVAIFQTPELQLYTCPEGQCHLRSPVLPSPVQAGLVGHDLTRRVVVLSNFTYLTKDWRERFQDRVQPQQLTQVTLQADRAILSVTLADINPLGMGVLLRKRSAEEVGLKISDRVDLSFQLPPNHRWNHLKGAIISLAPYGNLLLHVGIQFHPTTAQRYAIEKFMASREKEIVEELDQIYCRALEPRRVEDLYF